MLFEVAIIERPTKKDAEENGAMETLVFGPKFEIARDAASAGLKAIRSESAKDLDLDKCRGTDPPFRRLVAVKEAGSTDQAQLTWAQDIGNYQYLGGLNRNQGLAQTFLTCSSAPETMTFNCNALANSGIG